MAVTFLGKNEYVATAGLSSSPQTVTPSGTPTTGDGVLAIMLADSGTTLTPPSGWTTLYGPTTAGAVVFRVAYKILVGGDSFSFSFSGSPYIEIHCLAVRGSATVSLDSQSSAGSTYNSSADPNPPVTVAVASTSLAVSGVVQYGGSTASVTAPTGYTMRARNSTGDDGFHATKSLSSSGSEDPAAFTDSFGTGDAWNGFTVTFTDVSAGGNPFFAMQEPEMGNASGALLRY